MFIFSVRKRHNFQLLYIFVSDDDHLGLHHGLHPHHHPHLARSGLPSHMGGGHHPSATSTTGRSSDADDGKSGIPLPPSKPKIWSLADTAVCKTPPPSSQGPQGGQYGGHPQMHQQHLQQQPSQHGQQPQWGGGGGAGHQNSHFAGMRMFGHQLSAGGEGADTPPHTPPNNNLKNGHHAAAGAHGLAGLMGGMFNNSYNGLHNGYAAAAVVAASQQQQQQQQQQPVSYTHLTLPTTPYV